MCRARVGTPLREVIAGVGLEAEYAKVILGGPLGGTAVHTLDFPVTKNLDGVTLIPKADLSLFENEPCLSCGLCAMVCPVRLVPGMLSRLCEFGQFDRAQSAHIFSCTECGCCSYVCPAGRSMVQFMIHGKTELLAARRIG
jgi:electron transport complex protein RnfC